MTRLTEGRAVTLAQLLASREARQFRQKTWLARHGVTLVSFTVVSPGPVKDSAVIRRIFSHGIKALQALAQRHHWVVRALETQALVTGPEGLMAINASAEEVKRAAIMLEHTHLLGRLWDIDVLTPQGGILTRQQFALPARHCLLCSRPAALCSREQTHSLADLLAYMESRLDEAELAAHG